MTTMRGNRAIEPSTVLKLPFSFLYEITACSVKVLWSGGGLKSKVLRLYFLWKFSLKHLVCVWWLGVSLNRERFFGFAIRFANYETFLALFKEIFIIRAYQIDIGKPDPRI